MNAITLFSRNTRQSLGTKTNKQGIQSPGSIQNARISQPHNLDLPRRPHRLHPRCDVDNGGLDLVLRTDLDPAD